MPDNVSAVRTGGAEPCVSSRSIATIAGGPGTPVEVVLPEVDHRGVRVERDPVRARRLRPALAEALGGEHELEVVTGGDPELRRHHLVQDPVALHVHVAVLHREDEVLAGAHAPGDAVHAFRRNAGTTRHLVDVGAAPAHDQVVLAEERRKRRIGVADRPSEPADDLVGQVPEAVGPVAGRAGEVGLEDPLADRGEPLAELPPRGPVERPVPRVYRSRIGSVDGLPVPHRGSTISSSR